MDFINLIALAQDHKVRINIDCSISGGFSGVHITVTSFVFNRTRSQMISTKELLQRPLIDIGTEVIKNLITEVNNV